MNAKKIKILRAYGLTLPVADPLSRKEEFDLTSRIAGSVYRLGKTARKRFRENPLATLKEFGCRQALDDASLLIASHTRLVVKLAKPYFGDGREAGDLIQAGLIGLIIAIGRFEPKRKFRFTTYANWWVRACLTVAKHGLAVRIRVSPKVYDFVKRLKKEIRASEARGEAAMTAEELAARLGVSREKVETGRLAAQSETITSLDAVRNPGQDPLGHSLPDDEENLRGPDRHLIGAFEAATVRWAIDQLDDEREKRILELHYGFHGGDERTLAEIGEIWGLSRQRIQQLEEKAIQKLRRIILRRKLAP